MMECVSYHVMPEAVSLGELKTRCQDGQLMTLSDDDDALTLRCNVVQQVNQCHCFTIRSFGVYG